MKDRLIRGAVAGMLGALWIIPWNLFSFHVLHFAKSRWNDMLAQLVMGHPPNSTLDFVVSLALVVIWSGMLGALFVRVVIPERDGNYVLRGVGLGFTAWFLLFTLGQIFKIPRITSTHALTALSNWIAVVGWGIITGWLTGRWDSTEARN